MNDHSDEKRLYRVIKFDFDEFFGFCQEYYAQFGNLDIKEKCIVVKNGDKIGFIKRPNVEQYALKIYDIGAKFHRIRLAKTTGAMDQGTYHFEEKQFDRLAEIDPDWFYTGVSEYNEFYRYCKLYHEKFGDLNIPLRCVVIKDDKGEETFKNRDCLTEQEKEQVVFLIGKRLLEFAKRRGRLSSKNEHLINRQIERLNALDPYWSYSRDYVGNRVDPVTKKCVDKVKDEAKASNMRRNIVFDFDEFYSYLLLYNTRFNSMNISSKCVFAIDDKGNKRFVRGELAKAKNWEIRYRLGWFFKEVAYHYNHPDKGGNSVKRLTDEQYQKLNELCDGLLSKDKQELGVDYVTLEWVNYCNDNGIKKARVRRSTPVGNKTKPKRVHKVKEPKKEKAPQEELEDGEKKPSHKVPNIISDFDIFYNFCKYQKDTTGKLQFSRSKVVTYKDGDYEIEYPIGAIFRSACDTRYYVECSSKGESCDKPLNFVNLTDEQNEQMDKLDKYWFYPMRLQTELRMNERQEKRRAKQAELTQNM